MSVAWHTIVEADVLTVLSGTELAAYRAAALKAGQADPLQPTIDQVTDLVRGYIAGCSSNQLASGNTVPPRLLAPALDIITSRLPQRVNRNPSEGRKDKEGQAIALLRKVADCKFRIEDPETADDSESPSGGIELANSSTRTVDRSKTDGL